MTAISVVDLRKSFGRRRRALDGVSLSVEPGEMVALIGASGSGKSTLIRHVSGLLAADAGAGAGEVRVHGVKVQSGGTLTPEAGSVRRDVAVIFQQFNLVDRLSVLTNVLTGMLGRIPRWRGNLGWFRREETLAAMDALARVSMAETARQRASTLSGGQKQRAAIARALLQGAKVVLADEPIASLDPASAQRVMETLTGINRADGITMLVSLHQVEYARRFCPRTIAMQAGKVVFDGPSSALTASRLREIYGAASEELILPDAGDSRIGPASADPVRDLARAPVGIGRRALHVRSGSVPS